MTIYIILIVVVIILIPLIIPTIYAGLIGAPLVFTPKNAIREALEKTKAKKGEKLYDLGCGTGRILLIAEKEFGMETIGFELSPFIYWFAKLNLYLNSAKNSKAHRLNAYKQNLRDADIVFCFLQIGPMEELKDKFVKELKSGARIISYSFRIHGWEADETISGYPGNVYVYKMDNVRR